jgi:hypothetical protein
MVFLPIEKRRIKLVKEGQISPHETTSKGKRYVRGKIYLKDSNDVGSRYQLYEVENLHLIGTDKQHKKGKGFIVFIPV